jgi:hypothetical protein
MSLGWRGHRFGDVTILDALERLQPGRFYLEVALFAHQFFLFVLEIVNLIAIGACFGNLRQIDKTQNTQHNRNKHGMTNRTEASGQLVPDVILISTPGLTGTIGWQIDGERGGARHLYLYVCLSCFYLGWGRYFCAPAFELTPRV